MKMIKVKGGEFLGLETQREGFVGLLSPRLAHLPLKKVPSDRRFEHVCIRMKGLGATKVRQRQDDIDSSDPYEREQTSYGFYYASAVWCGTFYPLTSKLEYIKNGIRVWEGV